MLIEFYIIIFGFLCSYDIWTDCDFMLVTINDDFDLKKIADSGQCFRVKEFDTGMFRFVTDEQVLYVIPKGDNRYDVSCDEETWNTVWHAYFDFDRDYSNIRKEIPASDKYMLGAADCGKGIRILKQDPWEMLISFIISQRKSIPAIKSSIELICEKYGRAVTTEYEKIFLFPRPEAIYGNFEKLSECKLGYRLKYIEDAVSKVFLKELDLAKLQTESDSVILLEALKEVYGVGDKVANCIALFAYGRYELAPVDTWIKKVIEVIYGGVNPFNAYGDVAGIMQQYIFYYALTHKQEF